MLNLADAVQTMLLAGDIEMGHARALLALRAAEQIACANAVINRRLSVRETEKLVADWSRDAHKKAPRTSSTPDVKRLEEKLADWMTCGVSLKTNASGKGTVTIQFGSLDELDGVLTRIGFPRAEL